MLTTAERRKLDRIFALFQSFQQRQWACAVEADFWAGGCAFLRRGALLLFGGWRYEGFFVITPSYAVVEQPEIHDASRARIDVPVLNGRAVRIYEEDQGPWWGALRAEIPILEKWVEEIVRGENDRTGRAQDLARAAETVRNMDAFFG